MCNMLPLCLMANHLVSRITLQLLGVKIIPCRVASLIDIRLKQKDWGHIGVGRFRILGGPRFRILGGPRGGQIPSRHMTSMRRNDVASSSFRRHVPTRFLINQC